MNRGKTTWVTIWRMYAVRLAGAFMSTSRSRQAPIDYMSTTAENVMWALQPQCESDSAYHYGADISMLSQFGEEKEVLYPPCTMLQVQRLQEDESPSKTIKTFAELVGKAMESPATGAPRRRSTAYMAKREGPSLEKLITLSAAKAEMLTEGDKSFLAINVLPRFM